MATSARRSSRSSSNGAPMRTRQARRRLSPNHTLLGPSFNGDLLPQLEHQVVGSTMGLYFGQYQAIAERKRFESILSSRHKHHRFIDIRDGFSSHTDADDIYKMKVIVGYRRYYVCGTYDQSSPDTNASLRSYGVNEEFKGDVALFFYSVYEPERFLECIPRYEDVGDREEAIRRVLTAFTRNVRNHIENNATLRHSVRG